MVVQPHELTNPESSLDLVTRSTTRPPAPAPGPTVEEQLAELAELRRRIDQATATHPTPDITHCRDCHDRGFARAVDYIRDGGDL